MRQVYSTFAEKMHFIDIEHTHVHSFGHLVLPLQGTLNLKTRQRSLIVDYQHILFLPPECEHSYYSKERNEFLVFYIPYTMLSHNCADEVKYLELDARWRALRFLMLSECQNKKTNTTAMNQLLYYSFQLIQQNQEYPSIRYLQENYHTSIPLKTLAILEHYNISYYSQWFQKKMGVSVQVYLQKLRLQEAKRLLRETNYSILAIAQQVGYEHQASLTRIFKQSEGMAPSVYRNSSINK
ncbi:AraC family transcriptional regulator [Sporomusa sp.]|uniref:helix-turn-helix transcriptional regulator n=1 Tax=Sporomusa sp. TaxID=2078658 RepID=UPI002BA68D82|nr:AraC family transcriptional regulator [Sporomusa sp.]HWR45431.1 AraC family transcriptional regulator [Sporomusa sp.]